MDYKPINWKYFCIALKDARKWYLPLTYPDDLGALLPSIGMLVWVYLTIHLP